MNPSTLLHHIGGMHFYQPVDSEIPVVQKLLSDSLIQPVQQGKLMGYALTPAGYRRWIGHTQRRER